MFKKIVVIVFFISISYSFGQDENWAPAVPEPPEPVFDFEFQDFNKISAEDEVKILKALKEDVQRELKTIKSVNENKYFQLLRESQFKNMEFPFVSKKEKAVHERERKIFELEIKAEALVAKYDKAAQTEKEKIKEQLRTQLNELFNQKEERRKQEVEFMQQELIDLKKSLEVRQQNKKQIIEKRIQELLKEDQYLDWE
jgi:hypothetical protein